MSEQYQKMALALVRKKHQGQVDKAGKPYIEHLCAVAEAMSTDEEKAVALLHDIIEDTDTTADQLLAYGFPASIVSTVQTLTHRHNMDYKQYIECIAQNELARKVKLADLAHNMDLSRIPNITPKDRKRGEKYALAKKYLESNR